VQTVHQLFRLLARNVGGEGRQLLDYWDGRTSPALPCPSSVSICGHRANRARLLETGSYRRPPANPLRWTRVSIFSAISIEKIAKRVDQSRRSSANGAPNPKGRLVEQPRRRSGLRDLTDLRHQSGTDRNTMAKARLGQFPLWIAGYHHRLPRVDRLCGP
jgi:hypothetical protein